MKYLIDFYLKNNDEESNKKNIEALSNENVLKFNLNDDIIEITKNENNIIMSKDNNESNIVFNFILGKKTSTSYYIKNMNFYIDTEVLTKSLMIEKNKIMVEYDLWLSNEKAGSFKYEINIKEAD